MPDRLMQPLTGSLSDLMLRRIGLYAMVGMLLAGSLVACAGALTSINTPIDSADGLTLTAEEETPLPVSQLVLPAAATPAPLPARSSSITPEKEPLHVWWPDELYPPDSSAAASILAGQFDGFTAYPLEVRRKRSSGMGSILSTLRSAAPVAPGALPDLTLMRRSEMVTAANEGLLVPIVDWVPMDLIDDLPLGVRPLGEVNEVLYGVPYALNITHTIYRESVFPQPLLSFEEVLAQQPDYLFPAGAEQGIVVNTTVLLQYLAAGGQLADESGAPKLDHDPLLAVLTYYEQGVQQGIFSPSLLLYTRMDAYWNRFVTGEANLITVDTVTYLSRKDSVQDIGLGPIPTQNGTPIVALDGWMWVLITHDPDRQDQARAFISWMMRAGSQSEYTEAFGILPAQQAALELWDDSAYTSFVRSVIPNAVIVAGYTNDAAVALQSSIAAVLDGAAAEDVTTGALNQFSSP
jgi:hypothetical protein